MGCDIHLVLEKHDENLSEWVGLHDYGLPPSEAVQELPVGWMSFKANRRDYNFFAHLAGVRANFPEDKVYPYPEPKGIPADASSLTLYRFRQWENDAHSASWLPLKEFAFIYAREVKENVEHIVAERLEGGDQHETLQLYQEVAGTYIDDFNELDLYRIVFWFDN
jgi:hypothetical protein